MPVNEDVSGVKTTRDMCTSRYIRKWYPNLPNPINEGLSFIELPTISPGQI